MDQLVTGLRLEVKLNRPANVLGVELGGRGTDKEQRAVHHPQPEQEGAAPPPLSVQIFVTFSEGRNVPRLCSISFNGRQICPVDPGTALSTKTPPSSLPPEVSERVEKEDEEEPPTESEMLDEELPPNTDTVLRSYSMCVSDGSGQCGLVSVQPAPLVSHGQNTARGQFPWHAALYQSKDLNPVYKCGRSLISPKTILTAHCASKGSSVVRPVDPEILFVYLGKYHLNQWSEGGVQVKQVLKVLLHPDYNSSNYRSDLALLILTSPAQFNKYVCPICLWDSQQANLANVVNQQGTVAGWGYDETGKVTEELKMAKMLIVPQDVCLFSDRNFYPQFTSDKTYFAGFLNGTSVCNGVSGGGMVFSKKQADGPV
ncbi:chymotrypsin-like protease CTRL-1 isoform X2 [Periplaneta americana]|uniref:chymotrypsin-like protease CTRL-1 isoform X2 n=1 Tax=Periplaneta americana TaxID=6978 RepID=UPI0037E76F2A